MASLITAGDGTGNTTSPALVLGFEATQESLNIVHDIIGGGVGVTLVRPRPRSGTLSLLYLTEADADAARLLHGRETTFTLTDADRPTLTMTYAVNGTIGIALDSQGRRRWTVDVGFQELET